MKSDAIYAPFLINFRKYIPCSIFYTQKYDSSRYEKKVKMKKHDKICRTLVTSKNNQVELILGAEIGII